MGIEIPGDLGVALPFKHLYTLQIRETFAKEGVLGSINLFEWKRVGLMIMYLCCHRPFLCSPPWFRDSLARLWYFVADHIDEFVMKPAQRAAVRKNVDHFLRRLQPPGLFVHLFFIPGEMKLLRKKGPGAVCGEDGTTGHALQACEGLDCATPQDALWKTRGMG